MPRISSIACASQDHDRVAKATPSPQKQRALLPTRSREVRRLCARGRRLSPQAEEPGTLALAEQFWCKDRIAVAQLILPPESRTEAVGPGRSPDAARCHRNEGAPSRQLRTPEHRAS